MVTRTTMYADVTAELVYKDGGDIVKDVIEEAIPKCDSKEKAEMILEKEYKGKIVSILTCEIREEKRGMSDDDFFRYSHVINPKDNKQG